MKLMARHPLVSSLAVLFQIFLVPGGFALAQSRPEPPPAAPSRFVAVQREALVERYREEHLQNLCQGDFVKTCFKLSLHECKLQLQTQYAPCARAQLAENIEFDQSESSFAKISSCLGEKLYMKNAHRFQTGRSECVTRPH